MDKECEAHVPDEVLMARYAAGDAKAFDDLFCRYEASGFAFFIRETRSRERAEDLYQELFLRIHRARHGYDPTRPFRSWFFQIARRLLSDDAQRAFRVHEFPANEWEAQSDLAGAEEQVATREQLDELLGRLSYEERYLVLAAKLEEVGYAELAKRLHKSVDAVKKTVSRALQRVRADAVSHPVRTQSTKALRAR